MSDDNHSSQQRIYFHGGPYDAHSVDITDALLDVRERRFPILENNKTKYCYYLLINDPVEGYRFEFDKNV